MKYDHAVKYNGVIYHTGADVPVVEEKQEEVKEPLQEEVEEPVEEEVKELKKEKAKTK